MTRPTGQDLDNSSSWSLRVSAFRAWLRDRLAEQPLSINSVERAAGIPGNALGKFLRAERGARHSLTPLNLRRLAPILGVSEPTLLARAGHMSKLPESSSIEAALEADSEMPMEDKRLFLSLYRRLKSGPAPASFSVGAGRKMGADSVAVDHAADGQSGSDEADERAKPSTPTRASDGRASLRGHEARPPVPPEGQLESRPVTRASVAPIPFASLTAAEQRCILALARVQASAYRPNGAASFPAGSEFSNSTPVRDERSGNRRPTGSGRRASRG